MFTQQGIAVDAWARIEDGCSITYGVVGGEAEFEIGTRTASLSLVLTERGLAALADASQRALGDLRKSAGT